MRSLHVPAGETVVLDHDEVFSHVHVDGTLISHGRVSTHGPITGTGCVDLHEFVRVDPEAAGHVTTPRRLRFDFGPIADMRFTPAPGPASS